MSEDEPTDDEAERAEAELLAKALEQPSAARIAPKVQDALDAADVVAMLRAPTLSDARANAVLEYAEREIERKRLRKRNARWAFSGASALVAAAAALIIVMRPRAPSEQMAAAPEAANALRDAQLAWLDTPTLEKRAAIERALEGYRDATLSALEQRYAR